MDESIKEAQQLCKDLEYLCSQDDTLLEYIIDEYVYLLDDNRKAELRNQQIKNWSTITHDT